MGNQQHHAGLGLGLGLPSEVLFSTSPDWAQAGHMLDTCLACCPISWLWRLKAASTSRHQPHAKEAPVSDMWYVVTCVPYEMFTPLRFLNHFPSSTSESRIKVAKLPVYAERFHGLDAASSSRFLGTFMHRTYSIFALVSRLLDLCDAARQQMRRVGTKPALSCRKVMISCS